MPTPLDVTALRRRLVGELRARGPRSAADLRRTLGISQPSFSRHFGRDPALLRLGRGPSRRYAVPRALLGDIGAVPVWRIDAMGRAARATTLQLIEPAGMLVGEPAQADLVDNLPWFLEDARPRGFLGRLVPARHPDLELPADILRWATDDVLAYLVTEGWNLPGDLIVGERALQRWLQHSDQPPDVVDADERPGVYAQWCVDVLQHGQAGSSAAGERPKFLATVRRNGALVPVLVKFSPPHDSAAGRRVADLLICEHQAARTLSGAGQDATHTELLIHANRTFLEVERFDRVGWPGRRGVVSLYALDAAFTGIAGDWVDTTRALVRAGVVPAANVPVVELRHAFGSLIGNSDMHAGNISFMLDELRVGKVAPSYDMLPMRLSPRGGEVLRASVQVPEPRPGAAWQTAWLLAVAFWTAVAEDGRCSDGFRELARAHLAATEAQKGRLARLG